MVYQYVNFDIGRAASRCGFEIMCLISNLWVEALDLLDLLDLLAHMWKGSAGTQARRHAATQRRRHAATQARRLW